MKIRSWLHRQYRWPLTRLYFAHKWGGWHARAYTTSWLDGTHRMRREFLRRDCRYTGCEGHQLSNIRHLVENPQEWGEDYQFICGRHFCGACESCLTCEPGCEVCMPEGNSHP